MNPATPGPLTVLLVPPEGDTALLADECGGQVPVMHFDRIAGEPSAPCPVCGSPTRWFRPPTDQMDPCYICTADSGHDFPDAAVAPMGWQAGRQRGPYGPLPLALLLVHEGASVAMGCDRLARSMNVLPYGAYTEAWAHTMGRAYAGEHPGARDPHAPPGDMMRHTVSHTPKPPQTRTPGLSWCGAFVMRGDTTEPNAPPCEGCRWARDLHNRIYR